MATACNPVFLKKMGIDAVINVAAADKAKITKVEPELRELV